MRFPDHFSRVASDYATYRPKYPIDLFDWLASMCRRRELAWDCACGSGQASLPLAARFDRVVATDASTVQLTTSERLGNIGYVAAMAEVTPLAVSSVDLVTVAQALHWFVGQEFYAEVCRVARSGAVFAAWTYGLPRVESRAIEQKVHQFIDGLLGPYWPPEIRHVLEGYASIDLPFDEIEAPSFEMRAEWTLPRFLAFVHTWSAVGAFVRECGEDPVERLATEIEDLWGAGEKPQPVRWRINLRVGRIDD